MLLRGIVLVVGLAGIAWSVRLAHEVAASSVDRRIAILPQDDPRPLGADVTLSEADLNRKADSDRAAARETTPAQPRASMIRQGAYRPLAIDTSSQASQERLLRDAGYLASDELEGRGVGTRGLDLAADFIAEQFQATGLNTELYAGTPFHEFQLVSGSSKGRVQTLEFAAADHAPIVMRADVDFTSLLQTAGRRFTFPMVFAGYGITAPEVGYDDYAGLDVRGKAVVLLRHEPQSSDSAHLFGGEEPSDHAYLVPKILNAVQHGAAAIVLVTDRRQADVERSHAQPQDDAASAPAPLLKLDLNDNRIDATIPVVHCRRETVEQLLEHGAGITLSEWEAEVDRTQRPASTPVSHWTVRGTISPLTSSRTLKNVVATLDADGPLADETIIVGAHYDHLGRGGWGSLALGANSEVHNGADDNASGTAVMLEVARLLAARKDPLPRRVMLMAFTAEEMGLIGSRKYVQDPLVPLKQTIAMINLDMVGRLRNHDLTVYGTGTADEWPQLISEAFEDRNFRLQTRPSGYGPSDHASFYEHGVPVLHFFTGFHPQYHRPNDDVELLNIEGMQRIAEVVVDLVTRLAERPDRLHPRRSGDSLTELLAMESAALDSGRRGGNRPRLGVVLRDHQAGGALIYRVLDNGPASRQGFRPGDLILQIGEEPVKTVDDVQRLLDKVTLGSSIAVRLQRYARELELEVQF